MLVLACSVADLVDLRGQEVAKNLTFVMSKSTGKQGIYNGTDRSRWQENPNDQNGKCKYGNCYDQSKVVLQKPEFWLTFKPGHVQYEAPVGKAVGFDLYFVNLLRTTYTLIPSSSLQTSTTTIRPRATGFKAATGTILCSSQSREGLEKAPIAPTSAGEAEAAPIACSCKQITSPDRRSFIAIS